MPPKHTRKMPTPIGPVQYKTIHISISPPLIEHLVLLPDRMRRLIVKSREAPPNPFRTKLNLLEKEAVLNCRGGFIEFSSSRVGEGDFIVEYYV